jgi:hypothetical protein
MTIALNNYMGLLLQLFPWKRHDDKATSTALLRLTICITVIGVACVCEWLEKNQKLDKTATRHDP